MVARLDCSTKQSVQHGFCRKFNKGIIAMINDNKFEHLSKEDLLVVSAFFDVISNYSLESPKEQDSEEKAENQETNETIESNVSNEYYEGNVYNDPKRIKELSAIIKNYSDNDKYCIESLKKEWINNIKIKFKEKNKEARTLSLLKVISAAKKYWYFLEKYESNYLNNLELLQLGKETFNLIKYNYNTFLGASKKKNPIGLDYSRNIWCSQAYTKN